MLLQICFMVLLTTLPILIESSHQRGFRRKECSDHSHCRAGSLCNHFGSCVTCESQGCGVGSICWGNQFGQLTCGCPDNTEGDPSIRCSRVTECSDHSHCRAGSLCTNLGSCVTCESQGCGIGSICRVDQFGQLRCGCPDNTEGDPSIQCSRVTEDPMNVAPQPSPVSNFEDPMNVAPQPSPVSNFACSSVSPCGAGDYCNGGYCVPCGAAGCGIGANCKQNQARVVCNCPANTQGNPKVQCNPVTDDSVNDRQSNVNGIVTQGGAVQGDQQGGAGQGGHQEGAGQGSHQGGPGQGGQQNSAGHGGQQSGAGQGGHQGGAGQGGQQSGAGQGGQQSDAGQGGHQGGAGQGGQQEGAGQGGHQGGAGQGGQQGGAGQGGHQGGAGQGGQQSGAGQGVHQGGAGQGGQQGSGAQDSNQVGNAPVGNQPSGFECNDHSHCDDNETCKSRNCVDPCESIKCRKGVKCQVVQRQPKCSCPDNTLVDPDQQCQNKLTKGCQINSQCADNQRCQSRTCVDPCVSVRCGEGAICQVSQRQGQCVCPANTKGDPRVQCKHKQEPGHVEFPGEDTKPEKGTRDPGCGTRPDPGECRGAFKRYYYNKESDQCDCFLFGGCDEDRVKFSWVTLEECQRICVPGNKDQGPGCKRATLEEVQTFLEEQRRNRENNRN